MRVLQMQNTSVSDAWYASPLSSEDAAAGGVLLASAALLLPTYVLVAIVLLRNDKDVVGFRFLFSAAVADILLLINYGVWPGLTILFKSEIIAPWMRHWIQMYLDWAWFAMCYHYCLIAWSRFAAIRYPLSFRNQDRRISYSLCAACYIIAAIQMLCTHFQSWYVTFYYEPSAYGMLAEDFVKYMTEGQSLMFFSFHLLMILIPLFFYAWSFLLLIQHRRSLAKTDASRHLPREHIVERRLMIPCVINSAVFIVGQVVITVGTGEGKWATFSVMLLFSANSAVNPLLLLFFSATIRTKVLELVGIRAESIDAKYVCVPAPSMLSANGRSVMLTPLPSEASFRLKDGPTSL